MNNIEKKHHIGNSILFLGNVFTDEAKRFRKYLDEVPEKVYKYKKIDEYLFDMLERSYIFLSPVNKLDDPFDCLTNIDLDELCKDENVIYSEKTVSYMASCIRSYVKKCKIGDIKEIIKNSIRDGSINKDMLYKAIGDKSYLNNTEETILYHILLNFENVFEKVLTDPGTKGFIVNGLSPNSKMGVWAVSEIKNNKVMWSLYGDNYNGCCLEYRIPKEKNVLTNFHPVIYDKRHENNYLKRIIEFTIASAVRFTTSGLYETNLGSLTELFCSKDSDWRYQKEWRLLGKGNTEVKTDKLKAVYLGFRVSEQNTEKILSIAKSNNFDVYRMLPPNGKTNIKFSKIYQKAK